MDAFRKEHWKYVLFSIRNQKALYSFKIFICEKNQKIIFISINLYIYLSLFFNFIFSPGVKGYLFFLLWLCYKSLCLIYFSLYFINIWVYLTIEGNDWYISFSFFVCYVWFYQNSCFPILIIKWFSECFLKLVFSLMIL